ncbi:ECF-type sigma factor [Brevundimonas sp.]|uniref:ECF-type sigma factor n=1 Tax=Brevundimonas sp. TaxID=1871086 RepID=UPI00391D2370
MASQSLQNGSASGDCAPSGNAVAPPQNSKDLIHPADRHEALQALATDLYEDLHAVARRERRRAGRPLTWNTTALIHETYIRVHRREAWLDRTEFLAIAATAMRRVLIDAARARMAEKRGTGLARLPLEAADGVANELEDPQMVRLGDALNDLSAVDPELAQLVDCRFFAGLSEVETGQIMGWSERTVRRRWGYARAWLYREMTAA